MNFKIYLVQQGYSKNTIQAHLRNINEWMKWNEAEGLKEAHIAYNDLTAYIQHLQQREVQPQSINNRLNSIRHYFRFLIKENKRKDNPALSIQVKSIRKTILTGILTEVQLEELYKQYHDYQPYNRPKDKAAHQRQLIVLGFIIYQGLTAKELSRILTTDIDLTAGAIQVSATLTSNERILKLEAKQILPLAQHLQNRKEEAFIQQRTNDLLAAIKAKLKRITGNNISIEQLKASRIIIWLKQYNIRQAQYYAGFKYLSSMKKYQQQEMDSLREELEKHFPLE